jgi:hypothetical protein
MTSKVRLWVEPTYDSAFGSTGYWLTEISNQSPASIEVDADWWELYKEKARGLSDMQHEAALMAGYEND